MNILTIDTGTSNTRTTLWHDDVVVGRGAAPVGIRDTATSGSRAALNNAVRTTIDQALTQAGMQRDEIERVVGSGMITSSLGLCEVPHVTAPVGVMQLMQGMTAVVLEDIIPQPIWLIPGVRNTAGDITLSNVESMDMMRGEEVEAIGLIKRLELRGPALLIMPGSHSKFVSIDADNRINGCVTTLAGEMLAVITQETSLRASLAGEFATHINPELLLAGAATVRSVGLSRACFNVRLLDRFTKYSRNDRANYLLGAVFGSDLITLKNTSAISVAPDTHIIVTGHAIPREAMARLVREDPYFSGQVTVISDQQQANLAGFGALEVAAYRQQSGERKIISTSLPIGE